MRIVEENGTLKVVEYDKTLTFEEIAIEAYKQSLLPEGKEVTIKGRDTTLNSERGVIEYHYWDTQQEDKDDYKGYHRYGIPAPSNDKDYTVRGTITLA